MASPDDDHIVFLRVIVHGQHGSFPPLFHVKQKK
jgi:hypothetical protein